MQGSFGVWRTPKTADTSEHGPKDSPVNGVDVDCAAIDGLSSLLMSSIPDGRGHFA